MSFRLLSQRDPRWSSQRIGASNLTVGRFGCCLTSISMLSFYFNCFKSPLEIASNANNFTTEGLVNWNKLKFDNMKFAARIRGTPLASTIRDALKAPNKAIMLEVSNGSHWVVAVKYNWLGRLIVCDPWDGKLCDVLKVYSNITGAALFQRI